MARIYEVCMWPGYVAKIYEVKYVARIYEVCMWLGYMRYVCGQDIRGMYRVRIYEVCMWSGYMRLCMWYSLELNSYLV